MNKLTVKDNNKEKVNTFDRGVTEQSISLINMHRHILVVAFVLIFTSAMIIGCSSDASIEEQEPEVKDEQHDDDEMQEDEENQEQEELIEEEELEESDLEQSEEEARQLGDYNIYLGGEVVEKEGRILIYGESNLLPGARVVGSVSAGDDAFHADTTEIVQDDGSFYMEISHHDLNEKTTVTVMFNFDGVQDSKIVRHYGDKGQHLEGPYIYKHGRGTNIFQKAQVQVAFEREDDLVIRQFREPDWYPIPDDYGEPRVWIEVDDITNDKDYFYIHGRSNLLEGSRIVGWYGATWRSDDAWVKPDGSFDLRIEYIYLENTPFTIQFFPHRNQWNMVEEAYGKRGQKLVGDLVKTSNDRQYIELKVEQESTEFKVPDNVILTIEGTEYKMEIPDHLLFDFDESDLKSESKETLDGIIEALESFDRDVEVQIHGHTDNEGSKSYNQTLSEDRAKEVHKYLKDNGDFKNIQFVIKGFGETKPIATNDTEDGRAKNRRVEIVLNLR